MDFKLTNFELGNSLKVLYQKIPNATSLSVGLWVKMGSRYESDNERGYTHFVEHMLFKGTKKRTAKLQAEQIERVGGYFNAVTSREYTNFFITASKDDLKLSLDILSDMVFDPLLEKKDVQAESKVILEEMKSYMDSPDEFVYDEYFKNIFHGNSLGLDIIGTKESVESATETSLRNFYEKHYKPNRMILSIAGDYSVNEIKDLTNQFFSKKRKSSVFELNNSEVPKKFGTFFSKKKLEQVSFLLGAEGFPRDFKTAVRLGAISGIFGGGISSRLFQKIREEQAYCYSISAFPSNYYGTGIFTISCSTSKSNFKDALKSIIDEIKLLKEKGISEKELEFIKSNQKGSLSIGYENVESRMNDIAYQEIYFGNFYSYADRIKELYSITKKELNQLIDKIYSVEKLHLTGIGDFDPREIKSVNTKL
jgi:predicted Zn-dependent peptidase